MVGKVLDVVVCFASLRVAGWIQMGGIITTLATF